ncbi:hypothetical protein LEP1GSC128_2256 [Leptospira borgpetersenii str. 200801926]|uniref:Uncharacterized protein n=3 Tax=Leptospira borgpetersenii TaxID=174 RepID=M3FJN1_LEPBO|nr:hypothetical protein LEP1GSC128_2256 [Leptospira borgpetersenii str. 200801926]EMG02013.1 hypothetical protein LEP1GSC123_0323 [Leptospira borgpetersenii str. 200701203]EMN12844.1 hypothetical protein LEP1GSC055_3360 [Leptospira borgpetersenii str. Brem 307]EMN15442.1 hypothetical protein LEP1GSC056_3596 [Leptospira borgpetersenii str. Brem 328]
MVFFLSLFAYFLRDIFRMNFQGCLLGFTKKLHFEGFDSQSLFKKLLFGNDVVVWILGGFRDKLYKGK